MRSRISKTVERPSVRPSVCLSVCLSDRWTVAAACDGFAVERPAGRKHLSIASGAGAAYQLQARRAACAALSSKCGQRHVDSRRRRLNTNLLCIPSPRHSEIDTATECFQTASKSPNSTRRARSDFAGDPADVLWSRPVGSGPCSGIQGRI